MFKTIFFGTTKFWGNKKNSGDTTPNTPRDYRPSEVLS